MNVNQVYKSLIDSPSKEPALTTGLTVSTVTAVISAITVFFPHLLTTKQELVIYVVATFSLPLITSLFTRGRVWSPASVLALLEQTAVDAEKDLQEYKKPQAAPKKTD